MKIFVCLFAFLTLMPALPLSAQVVNSLSRDKVGMYTHALDTVITCLKKGKRLQAIFVKGEQCAARHLPATHQNVTIITDEKSIRKKRKLKSDEVYVTINCLTIDRDYVTIIMTIFDGQTKPFIATYQYQPATMDYRLKALDQTISFH